MKKLLKLLMITTVLAVPTVTVVACNNTDTNNEDLTNQKIADELAENFKNDPLFVRMFLTETKTMSRSAGNKIVFDKIEQWKADFKKNLSSENQKNYNSKYFKVDSEIYSEPKLENDSLITENFYQESKKEQLAYFNFSYGNTDKENAKQHWGVIKVSINEKQISLKDIIQNTDLGNIYIGQKDSAYENEIKAELKKRNPNVDINEIEINVKIPSATLESNKTITATVKPLNYPNDSIYTGEVPIKFSLENFKQLNSNEKNFTKIIFNTDNRLYAINQNGLYKSANGKDFERLYKTQDGQYFSALTNDKNGNIYVGFNSVIYKYDDANNTLKPFSQNFGSWISTLLAYESNGIINIAAGTSNGLFWHKSFDGGDFQSIIIKPNSAIYSLAIGNTIDNKTTIYAGTKRGLYKITEEGVKHIFNKMVNPMMPSFQESTFLDITYDKEHNIIYAATEAEGVVKISYEKTFTKMDGLEDAIDYSIAIDRKGNIYVGDQNRIYKSSNNEFFVTVSTTYKRTTSIISDNDNNIYAATDDGILISESFS